MRNSWALLVIATLSFPFTRTDAQERGSKPQFFPAYCAADGFYEGIPEWPKKRVIARLEDLTVEAQYQEETENSGPIFRFIRNGRNIYSFRVREHAGQNWIAVDHEHHRIAWTYSDAGALGIYHVRIFQIDGDSVKDLSAATKRAMANFKTRHYCEERGNNVKALKWIDGDLLLTTDVYDTGDCGKEMGHMEGYRISVPDGGIKEHLSLAEMSHYPGVCTSANSEIVY